MTDPAYKRAARAALSATDARAVVVVVVGAHGSVHVAGAGEGGEELAAALVLNATEKARALVEGEGGPR